MKTFSTMLCAGLLLAAPALAATPAAKAPAAKAPAAKAAAKAPAKAAAAKLAPGDLKSGGAIWNVSTADSVNQDLVVNLVTPPAKGQLGDKDVLAASAVYFKGQKAMKGCAASGAPQPVAWATGSVWVVSYGCN